MQEKDIQELFAYIRKRLPKAKAPSLTRRTAAAMCKHFEGYTLEQLFAGVDQWAAIKPFWPDPDELTSLLPPPVRDIFKSNGYQNADDYKAQLLALIERSRREDELLEAHGL